MSYKPEVFVDGQWASNALAFRTEKEALISAHELMSRWLKVEDYRAVESEQAVNYEIVDGVMHVPVMYPVIPEEY
jgi:hypothetical protein